MYPGRRKASYKRPSYKALGIMPRRFIKDLDLSPRENQIEDAEHQPKRLIKKKSSLLNLT